MNAQERMEYLTKIVKGEVKHTSYNNDGEAYENEPYISDKMKAIDILNKYGLDVHGTEFMSDPAQLRRLKQIIDSDYPLLKTSNIKAL